MEPIATAIVSAISSGAAVAGKDVATQALKDAYAGLKGWLKNHHPGVKVSELEKEPMSKPRQEAVAEDLAREGALSNSDLIGLAHTVLELVRKEGFEVARSIGVDLGQLEQANVTFGNVLAGKGATGVKVDNVRGGTLSFQDVVARFETDPSKKA